MIITILNIYYETTIKYTTKMPPFSEMFGLEVKRRNFQLIMTNNSHVIIISINKRHQTRRLESAYKSAAYNKYLRTFEA